MWTDICSCIKFKRIDGNLHIFVGTMDIMVDHESTMELMNHMKLEYYMDCGLPRAVVDVIGSHPDSYVFIKAPETTDHDKIDLSITPGDSIEHIGRGLKGHDFNRKLDSISVSGNSIVVKFR